MSDESCGLKITFSDVASLLPDNLSGLEKKNRSDIALHHENFAVQISFSLTKDLNLQIPSNVNVAENLCLKLTECTDQRQVDYH